MYNRDEAERVIVLSCLLYILTECAVMQSSDYEQVLRTEPRLKGCSDVYTGTRTTAHALPRLQVKFVDSFVRKQSEGNSRPLLKIFRLWALQRKWENFLVGCSISI